MENEIENHPITHPVSVFYKIFQVKAIMHFINNTNGNDVISHRLELQRTADSPCRCF